MPIASFVRSIACGVAIALGSTFAVSTAVAQSGGARDARAIRAVLFAEMKVIDPLFLSYMSRYHGYMVYDTLFSQARDGSPKPQMVESFTVSPDRLKYRFTLRPQLSWSDGSPVRSADVIASLERWGKVDPTGRELYAGVDSVTAENDRTFTIALKKPFGLVIEALAKPGTFVPFIVPERMAKLPPTERITDPVGSGPYMLKTDEWVPGHKVVYVKNPRYVPRPEPSGGLAGGKVARAERVEWLYMPDQNSALAALQNGEIDFLELPPLDFMSILSKDPNIKLSQAAGLADWQGQFRINHLHPPFDSAKGRQALMALIDQREFMKAIGAPEGFYKPVCASFFLCGGPYETQEGKSVVEKPSVAQARKLLAESGYKGQLVVVMQPVDLPASSTSAELIFRRLKDAGVNAQLVPVDFGTMQARRIKKDAPENGGWSIFPNYPNGYDLSSPATNTYLSFNCTPGAPGFECDDKLKQLREQFFYASDEATRKTLARQIEARMFDFVPYAMWGQFRQPSAYRKELSGLIETGIPVFWNVQKR